MIFWIKVLHNIIVIKKRGLLFPYLSIGVINLHCIKRFRWQTFWLTSLSSRFSSLFDERYVFGICLWSSIIKGKWDKNWKKKSWHWESDKNYSCNVTNCFLISRPFYYNHFLRTVERRVCQLLFHERVVFIFEDCV